MLLIESLRKVREATDCAITEAQKIQAEFKEAINWTDLRCERVFFWQDDSGDSGYSVEISEVDYSAVKLGKWIADKVEKETGIPVEVRFDW